MYATLEHVRNPTPGQTCCHRGIICAECKITQMAAAVDGEGHTVAHVATNHCHQAWECVRCGCVSEWDNYGERTCWCDSCSSCVGGRACKYPPHRHAMEHEMKQIFAVLAAQLRPGMCSVPAKERGSPANLRRLGRYHWHPLLWGLMGPA